MKFEEARDEAQGILLDWMRECRIKTPMSDVPDVLASLSDDIATAIQSAYEKGARDGRRLDKSSTS